MTPRPAVRAETVPDPTGAGYRVVLVDDRDGRTLLDWGFPNIREAHDWAAAEYPDLPVVDLLRGIL